MTKSIANDWKVLLINWSSFKIEQNVLINITSMKLETGTNFLHQKNFTTTTEQ